MAQEVIGLAERAHARLTEQLGFDPGGRTSIVLSDLTDAANGNARVIPRNIIRLYATAPDDLATIGDYDDWMTLLVTHEHTHIHHLGEIGGIPAFLNTLLGPTYAPNALQPGWVVEGIATYEESVLTSAGRLRSSLVDMYLRTDVLADRVMDLAEISNDAIRWPHGDVRYLYGAYFIAHIAEHHGRQALHTLGTHYGRQPLPFGLNRVAIRATGQTFTDLYRAFVADLRARVADQVAEVRARGVVEGVELVAPRDVVRSPRYLGDGRLAYYARDGRVTPEVRTTDGEKLMRARGTAYVSPHPDGRHVLVGMSAPHRDIYTFDDLFSLDLASGELTRLTHGMRARHPDVSPDGQWVTFVTQASGTAWLERARLEDVEGTRERLYRGRDYDQVFTPRFSPDGRSIVFSAWRKGGYRDILLLDLATRRVTELTRDRAQDTGPAFTRDGARVLFSSDRDGIPNLYAFELASGLTRRLTNVLGGAFQPEPTPDGQAVTYVSYGSRGFGLAQVPLFAEPPVAEPYQDRRPAPTTRPAPRRYPVEDYSPWPTLLPANYELTLESGGPVGTELHIQTYGRDVAEYHAWSMLLRLAFDDRYFAGASAGYAYQRLPIRPTLNLFHGLNRRSDLFVGGERRSWLAEETGVSVGLGYRFASVFGSHALSVGYALTNVQRAGPLGGRLDPTEPAPRLPQLGLIPSVGMTLSHEDVRRQAYDVTPSEGQVANLRIRVTDPILGRDTRSVRLQWDFTQYASMPFADNHVLALRYSGGHSSGDPDRIDRFNLGGYVSSSPFSDLSGLLLDGSFVSVPGIALRGFPQGFRTGAQLHLGLLEYRFPLLAVDWGVSTLPFYVRRVYGSVFANAGDAFDGKLNAERFAGGAGGELFVQMELAYRLNMTLRFGLAQGFTENGETQFYFNLGTPF